MRRLVLLLLIAGCNHSPVTSWTPDAGDVWDQGPPIQLTPQRVQFRGFTADGTGILIARRGQPVGGPSGGVRRDTSDIGVSVLPISGGSAAWQFRNQGPSQSDSTNRIISAAFSVDGRLLYVEETGPIVFDTNHYPVFWHQELYLGTPQGSPGVRRLLTLFDEVVGQPTVPHGTINTLDGLQWLDHNRFLATAAHRTLMPGQDVQRIGLVVGKISPDTVTTELVDNLDGIERFAPAPDGTVLLQSSRELWILTLADKRRELLVSFPSSEERVVLTSRCDLAVCWAIVWQGADPQGTWEVWRVDRQSKEARMLTRVVFLLGATPLLPPSGQALIATHSGILYRIDNVLSD